MAFHNAFRAAVAAAVLCAFVIWPQDDRVETIVAQAPPAEEPLYIMPLLTSYRSLSDEQFAFEVGELRRRIGEGSGVRVGFAATINVTMPQWTIDPDDAVAVRAALAGTIADIDAVIARALPHKLPVSLSILTAIRSAYDPFQAAAEAEDRRNMQWFSNNALAAGWLTHSRYARRQRRLFEAYVRELGRAIATRMSLYPDIVVAASGDGEVELAFEPPIGRLADYSPFAVAEFRDWLRAAGLYAPGQIYEGQAYSLAARYAGDPSPAVDGTGDGFTLNGDFGTAFDTWGLRHFDWDVLLDSPNADARAIPSSEYSSPGWNPEAISNPNGFDPPRDRALRTVWSDVWHQFRSTMVWRHNLDFARWITTSPDAAGARVPASRWYSYQIPADYIFNGTPAQPNERFETSASAWWTADVAPYGGIGITAFNINIDGTNYFRTLSGVAPAIAGRGRRWGIIEWHPSVPLSFTSPPPDTLEIYRQEMALVERYGARLVVPFAWDFPPYAVKDTGFEVALRELVDRIRTGAAWQVDRAELRFTVVRAGSTVRAVTGAQEILVTQAGNQQRIWTVLPSQPWITSTIGSAAGSARLMVGVNAAAAPLAGTFNETLTIAPADGAGTPVSVRIVVTIVSPATSPPFGSFDTPADGSLLTGSVAVTGWALDDVEVARVEIWRDAHRLDPPAAIAVGPGPQAGKVYIGNGTFIDGVRTDVAATYPGAPRALRGGWGYLMLTRGLVWERQGAFNLHALAYDVEGRVTPLGAKRVSIDNSITTRPFGAIDTPAQGETVSGIVNNFGWVLATPGRNIPEGNVLVAIDNVFIGSPGGLSSRPDIDAGFAPQGFDTSQAQRVFTFDSRAYADGLHTIGWFVIDSTGEADGIGSRFFRVVNATSAGGQ